MTTIKQMDSTKQTNKTTLMATKKKAGVEVPHPLTVKLVNSNETFVVVLVAFAVVVGRFWSTHHRRSSQATRDRTEGDEAM
eukprot:CAMPEP_0172465266 /NCGR_PEP_ID=MMETSP1065-20121228/52963_1 /TAXON_ID=265537 /ORGANISM="Amphiprora paludosa, Strain CCMP125" /LENGTH=80 /DNA_ID=CAMNT_0013221733 /DNA_START=151 /DNA_END=390 /DNA_ORIENTATION=+